MTQQDTISRKEITTLTGGVLTENVLCKREAEFKLDKARIPLTSRPILYWKKKVVAILTDAGVLVDGN